MEELDSSPVGEQEYHEYLDLDQDDNLAVYGFSEFLPGGGLEMIEGRREGVMGLVRTQYHVIYVCSIMWYFPGVLFICCPHEGRVQR